jgi:predicted Rdx family selenoprotein
MRPRVCGDLMTLAVHSSNDFWPSCLLYINLTFPKVVTGNEEGGFSVIAGENIEQMTCKVKRTVIEGQRNITIFDTIRYAFAIVGDVTNQWSRNVDGGFPEGFRVRIAAVAESDLASRTRAVVETSTAITARGATTIEVTSP